LSVIYVVTEMGEVVLTYELEAGGGMKLLQSSTVVTSGTSGEGSKSAEIALLPDGSTLYATNRAKENTVTAFSVDATGLLDFKQQVEAPAFPRGMTLANGGSVLLVAGQSKTELWSYIVEKDGSLTRSGYSMDAADLPPNPATLALVADSSGSRPLVV